MRNADETTHFFFGWLCIYIHTLESANLKHECKISSSAHKNPNFANQPIEICKTNSTPSAKFPLNFGAFCP